MDTRNGNIYRTREDAIAAGVPEDFLVTGTERALTNLKQRFKFTKGSFKAVAKAREARTDEGADTVNDGEHRNELSHD